MMKFTWLTLFAFISTATLSGCMSSHNKQPASETRTSVAENEILVTDIQPRLIARTNDAEKKILTRLVHYLNELDTLADEAEFKSNPDARIHFDYRQLDLDLSSIIFGIQTYLRTPDYQPRTLKPMGGHYGR